jgi:hypothetical protein
LYATNFFVGTFFTLFAGLFVFLKGEAKKSTKQTWLLLCLSTSLWHAGRFFIAVAPTASIAQQIVYMIYLGAILIPPFYLHFCVSLIEDRERENVTVLMGAYAAAVIELLLLVTGQLISGVRFDPNLGFYEIPGRLYFLHFFLFVSVPAYGLAKLIGEFRKTELPVRKNQLKYVIYASVVGFLGGGTSFLPIVEAPIPPFGAPLTYFYTFPIAYAIARYRLMDIGVVLRRGVIYVFLLLALLLPCYLVVVLSQYLAFNEISYPFSLVALTLLMVVGFVFPKFRFKTEDALERALFKKRSDYRETLLKSSREMVSVMDLKALSESLVDTIGRALCVEKVSLFLLNDTKGIYNLMAWSANENTSGVMLTTKQDPVVEWLSKHPEPTVREELQMAPDGVAKKQVAARMGQLDAEIAVPIISKEKLIGILNLGHKEEKEIYSSEDLELLSTLANQAAIAIENARLYENLK